MASLLKAYNALLIRRPMAAQCATAALLFGAGDVLAQQAIERRGRRHDFVRTARLSFYGGALFGPVITKWFTLLNRLQFASPTRGIVYKVWLDQAIASPAVVAYFFTSMTLLEGKPLYEVGERLGDAYVPTLLRNWCVFVPAQALNFAVVPAHMRFVFVSVVSLFWNTYLSAVNAQTKAREEGAGAGAGHARVE
ncbi:hypothetical protein GLOTRDRAFT_135830 [Gloeophyllum trabeum ATCC 11539]|uniref:Uncharacterized protein n=1 Tax=Gloeophyllum trabeum (strain ATCC 11539 / FP-39264 / Madison 617) TaxID=670483 RepID=S7QPA1_GLOTA|nr:uncharacterized protein GLOTRDRAFT_135830 [Gloeophyllum trabeum ATCC 11539]EPQ61353.1 hypothetical protein GLOTRDRAFT_135830 [Gloeophyllum trabeum ATCC 11539]